MQSEMYRPREEKQRPEKKNEDDTIPFSFNTKTELTNKRITKHICCILHFDKILSVFDRNNITVRSAVCLSGLCVNAGKGINIDVTR